MLLRLIQISWFFSGISSETWGQMSSIEPRSKPYQVHFASSSARVTISAMKIFGLLDDDWAETGSGSGPGLSLVGMVDQKVVKIVAMSLEFVREKFYKYTLIEPAAMASNTSCCAVCIALAVAVLSFVLCS